MVNLLNWNWLSTPEPMQGTDNLRRYIADTTLPPMPLGSSVPLPPAGHKSHRNALQVRSENYRVLEQMEVLDESNMREAISEWCSTVPNKPVEGGDEDSNGLTLSTPCHATSPFRIPAHYNLRTHNLRDLLMWLKLYPLNTVERLLHLLYPEQTHNWRFDADDPSLKMDPDNLGIGGRPSSFGFFRWSLDPGVPLNTSPDRKHLALLNSRSVIVAYQPPWILSEADIREFANCEDFPPFTQLGFFRPLKLNACHRNWAKLYDLCVQKGASYFVLTSYHHWVFGRFSPQYTRCHVSKVFSHDASGPTIIEHLAYWVASAMGLSNTFPKLVFFEPMLERPPQVPTIRNPMALLPEEEPSESNWDGKSILPGSSAGVQLTTPAVSVNSTSLNTSPVDRPTYRAEKVLAWINTLPSHPERNELVPTHLKNTRKPEVLIVPQKKQAGHRPNIPNPKADTSRIGDVMWYS